MVHIWNMCREENILHENIYICIIYFKLYFNKIKKLFYRNMFFAAMIIHFNITLFHYSYFSIFLDKAVYITLKVSLNRKCISFNRRKSISLTATCISGSRLLPMFRLHGTDRWNLRRCMRRLGNRKRFETGARRQIKILCRIRRKRATVSDAEQTMDVIAFVTATQYATFVSIFALSMCEHTLHVSHDDVNNRCV